MRCGFRIEFRSRILTPKLLLSLWRLICLDEITIIILRRRFIGISRKILVRIAFILWFWLIRELLKSIYRDVSGIEITFREIFFLLLSNRERYQSYLKETDYKRLAMNLPI